MKKHSEPSQHIFEYRAAERGKLLLSLYITLAVMLIELVGGVLSNSIALVSDAGHMFTHCFAIGIGLIAIFISSQPTCHHKTFGMYRAEVLAAFINGIFLMLVVIVIIYEACLRILHPKEVLTSQMLVIAILGLGVNIATIYILNDVHDKGMNIKSVFYHMIADAASSVGIVIAAVVIAFTGWNVIDPIISIAISLIIAYWAWGILKESTGVLLEMAPPGMDVDKVEESLKARFPEIKEMNSAHLWTITSNMLVFSAHVLLHDFVYEQKSKLASRINKHLFEKFMIAESTIQIVYPGESGLHEEILH